MEFFDPQTKQDFEWGSSVMTGAYPPAFAEARKTPPNFRSLKKAEAD